MRTCDTAEAGARSVPRDGWRNGPSADGQVDVAAIHCFPREQQVYQRVKFGTMGRRHVGRDPRECAIQRAGGAHDQLAPPVAVFNDTDGGSGLMVARVRPGHPRPMAPASWCVP